MTPNTVPSTFPWHRLCNTDHKTFSLSLCLAMVSRLHAFFAFSLRNKITNEKRAKQRIQPLWKHRIDECSRLRSSRSQRFCGPDRWWASCHHPRKYSCRTPWAHNLCWRRTWPGGQTARSRAECAWPALLGSGKLGKKMRMRAGECVYTHRRTHSGCYYVGANPCGYDSHCQKQKKSSPTWENTLTLQSKFFFWSLPPGLGPLVRFPPIIRCMS